MRDAIVKLIEEAEAAQADYEALLNLYEHSSGLEKLRLFTRRASSLTRRDETVAAAIAALRTLQK
jgi:hypothetical protein